MINIGLNVHKKNKTEYIFLLISKNIVNFGGFRFPLIVHSEQLHFYCFQLHCILHWLLINQAVTSIEVIEILYRDLYTVRLRLAISRGWRIVFGVNSVKAAVNGPILILNHKASLIRFRCFHLCLLLNVVILKVVHFFDMQLSQKTHPGLIVNVFLLSTPIYFAHGRVKLHNIWHTGLDFWFDHWLQNFLKNDRINYIYFLFLLKQKKDQTLSTCTI